MVYHLFDDCANGPFTSRNSGLTYTLCIYYIIHMPSRIVMYCPVEPLCEAGPSKSGCAIFFDGPTMMLPS